MWFQRALRHRWLFSGTVIALTAISLVTAFVGQPSTRAGALLGAWTFAVGGGGWVVVALRGPSAPAPYQGQVRLPSGVYSPGLVLPFPVDQARAGLLSVAACAGIGVALTVNPAIFGQAQEMRWFWLVIAAVLLWGLVQAFRRFGRTDYMLALTRHGMFFRLPAGESFAPWNAIKRVSLDNVRGTPFLALDMRERGLVEGTDAAGIGAHMGDRLMFGHDWTFPLAGLARSPEAVLELVTAFVEDPSRRAQLGSGPVPAAPESLA